LPPEFAADLLIRSVSSQIITEQKWKGELLQEAFNVAGNAQLSFPRIGSSN